MRKVVILGNSGSGKTTLSKSIAGREGLAHLDLDTLAWLPTKPPQRSPLSRARETIEDFVEFNEGWVIEGCYTDLLEFIAPFANELIFLNLSVEQCIENAKNRPWEPHKYKTKEEQDNNLDMLIDWISQYTERDDVFSFSSHMMFYESFEGRKSIINTNKNHSIQKRQPN